MTPALAALAAAALVVAGAHLIADAPTRPRRLAGDPGRATDTTPAWVAEGARQLGLAMQPSALWVVLRAGALVVTVLAAALWGIPGTVVVAGAAAGTPRAAARMLHQRRLQERDHQLPEALERLSAALRAGAPPGPAFVEAARGQQGALGEELRHVARGLSHGEPLTGVLERWAALPGASPAVALTAAALGLGAAGGGEVARAVDGVSATLRERRQLQAEVRALATQARTSAWLLAAAPAGFAALVATVEPAVVRFLATTAPGLLCLVLGVALDALGLWWMRRIVGRAT